MANTIIKIENLSKEYYLGEVGTGTLSHDLHRWWARIRGKEDPYSPVASAKTVESSQQTDYLWALKDINLEINEGDILGIIGRNGAGKSTLLKIISRITAPTTGVVKAKGRIASLLEVGTGMHPELTGRENIYLNGAILGMKKHEINKRFDEIVEFSGCELFIDTPIKRYSTGMRVRLGFAVAAFLDAEILIVDEVLAVGDLQFQNKCVGKLEEIGKAGRTILFVSHNMATLKVFCNKGIELDSGGIMNLGPVDEVISQYIDRSSNSGQLTGHFKNTSPDLTANERKADLVEMYITDSKNRETTRINVDQSFSIHMTWQLRVEVPFLRVCIELVDSSGTVILMTEDTDTSGLYGLPRKPGTYQQTVTVPELLLMPKIYSVNIYAGMPRIERLFEANNILQFEILENNTHLSSITGVMRSGYISTPLKWRVMNSEA